MFATNSGSSDIHMNVNVNINDDVKRHYDRLKVKYGYLWKNLQQDPSVIQEFESMKAAREASGRGGHCHSYQQVKPKPLSNITNKDIHIPVPIPVTVTVPVDENQVFVKIDSKGQTTSKGIEKAEAGAGAEAELENREDKIIPQDTKRTNTNGPQDFLTAITSKQTMNTFIRKTTDENKNEDCCDFEGCDGCVDPILDIDTSDREILSMEDLEQELELESDSEQIQNIHEDFTKARFEVSNENDSSVEDDDDDDDNDKRSLEDAVSSSPDSDGSVTVVRNRHGSDSSSAGGSTVMNFDLSHIKIASDSEEEGTDEGRGEEGTRKDKNRHSNYSEGFDNFDIDIGNDADDEMGPAGRIISVTNRPDLHLNLHSHLNQSCGEEKDDDVLDLDFDKCNITVTDDNDVTASKAPNNLEASVLVGLDGGVESAKRNATEDAVQAPDQHNPIGHSAPTPSASASSSSSDSSSDDSSKIEFKFINNSFMVAGSDANSKSDSICTPYKEGEETGTRSLDRSSSSGLNPRKVLSFGGHSMNNGSFERGNDNVNSSFMESNCDNDTKYFQNEASMEEKSICNDVQRRNDNLNSSGAAKNGDTGDEYEKIDISIDEASSVPSAVRNEDTLGDISSVPDEDTLGDISAVRNEDTLGDISAVRNEDTLGNISAVPEDTPLDVSLYDDGSIDASSDEAEWSENDAKSDSEGEDNSGLPENEVLIVDDSDEISYEPSQGLSDESIAVDESLQDDSGSASDVEIVETRGKKSDFHEVSFALDNSIDFEIQERKARKEREHIQKKKPVNFKRNRDRLTDAYFREFNSKVFRGSLDSVEVIWSKRLTTTAGITRLKRQRQAGIVTRLASIELSTKMIDQEDRLRSTLMHEMCHAAAWLVDDVVKPPHGKCFKKWASLGMRKVRKLLSLIYQLRRHCVRISLTLFLISTDKRNVGDNNTRLRHEHIQICMGKRGTLYPTYFFPLSDCC